MTTTEEYFADIDWKLLREQKLALLNALPAIEGIINLLDDIQDHAVDVLGVPAEDVFLTEDDEEIGTCDECNEPHENGGSDHCTECGNCSEHCAQYVDCPDKED